jgi:hypothetical protein
MAWLTPGARLGHLGGMAALPVLDEVVHHGAEAGLLRDLYAHRDALGG